MNGSLLGTTTMDRGLSPASSRPRAGTDPLTLITVPRACSKFTAKQPLPLMRIVISNPSNSAKQFIALEAG
jgi:hypothetical protein